MSENKTKKKTGRMTKAAAMALLMPRSEAELNQLISDTIRAQTVREEAVALLDRKVAEAMAHIEETYGYQAVITEADVTLARNLELVEMWADQHPEEFGKGKSVRRAGARFGWRVGNWKTELKRGIKWEGVIHQLVATVRRGEVEATAEAPDAELVELGRLAMGFLRQKVEADKEAMLAAREVPEAVALLEEVGVLFNQEERFFLEPEREGQADPTLTKEAGL